MRNKANANIVRNAEMEKIMQNKEDIVQWMSRLQMYARKQKLPVRILDELEECQAHLEAEDLSWENVRQRIEEVLESIRQKEAQSKNGLQNREDGSPSVQKVQEQVRKMATECQGENQDSVTGIEERKNLNIRECYRKMNEISYTKAHFEQMLDENRYLDFFEQVGCEYERNAVKTVQELYEDMGENYSHMLDHMRSMFQNIGGLDREVGNEKFYRAYETRRTGLEQAMKQEAEAADFGKNVIMEFAHKTKEGVGKRMLNLLPLFLFLVIIMVTPAVKYRNTDLSEVAAEESVGEQNQLQSAVNEFMKENMKEFVQKAMKGDILGKIKNYVGKVMYFSAGILIVLQSWFIFFIVLIIAAYAAYLKFLGKWYRAQICGRCESYLKGELSAFFDQNPLRKKTDETVAYLVEEYERQYLAIFNHIFKGTKYEERQEDDALSCERFIQEWELLK